MTDEQIKAAKWSDRPKLAPEVVREVAKRYDIALTAQDKLGDHDPSCGQPRCEIDHRIPRGCGGADVADNLSYQTSPWWQRKDRLEHWFERQVKLGKISVEACQQAFSAPNDWRARYKVVFGEEP